VLAGRVISLSVELNGKQVLWGGSGDDGVPRPYTVWRYLKTTPLKQVEGFPVPTKLKDPSEGFLKGDIVVKVQYGAEARATELRLKSAPGGGWLIDPQWVEVNGPPGDAVEEERQITTRRAFNRSRREAYLRDSFLAVGSAAASWVGCLTVLAVLFIGKSRPWLKWVCVAALVTGGIAVAWRFIGSPYFPDDERAYELRSYAMWAGAVSSGLAVVTWFFACRRKGPAEPPGP